MPVQVQVDLGGLGAVIAARAYAKSKQWGKSVGEYSKALDLQADDAETWAQRGLAYNELKQWDNAASDYSRAIELEPKRNWLWNSRGIAYANSGQIEKALADFSTAIEVAPDAKAVGSVYDRRADAYRTLDRFPEALADYQKALELAPDNAVAHNNLAWLLATCPAAEFRDAQRALELAKKAVELDPKRGYFWGTLGAAHYRAGEWKDGVDALKKSDELLNGGMFSFNAFFLAMAHWQLDQKDEARKWYDQAIEWMEKNRPQDEELKRFRAETTELLGLKEKND
jgi:tetratricopeptide (TPR) repeat protein